MLRQIAKSNKIWLIAVGLLAVGTCHAAAQGSWFDIGSGQSATIRAQSDQASFIYYPPYPFGNIYPPGTLVYSELSKGSDEQFAALYFTYFNDGGCGCGGTPSEPITYRLHYDEAALSWPEATTTLYIKVFGEWVETLGTVLDTNANTVTYAQPGVTTNGFFAIGSGALVPVEASSWGRIKALYDD